MIQLHSAPGLIGQDQSHQFSFDYRLFFLSHISRIIPSISYTAFGTGCVQARCTLERPQGVGMVWFASKSALGEAFIMAFNKQTGNFQSIFNIIFLSRKPLSGVRFWLLANEVGRDPDLSSHAPMLGCKHRIKFYTLPRFTNPWVEPRSISFWVCQEWLMYPAYCSFVW